MDDGYGALGEVKDMRTGMRRNMMRATKSAYGKSASVSIRTVSKAQLFMLSTIIGIAAGVVLLLLVIIIPVAVVVSNKNNSGPSSASGLSSSSNGGSSSD